MTNQHKIYKELKDGTGTTFRLATEEEIECSNKAHKDGGCDAGYCAGVFIDTPGYFCDIRSCAICGSFIGLI